MKVLLTGANGYIGMRILPLLVQAGHEVVCTVRDAIRFECEDTLKPYIEILEVDFLKEESLDSIPDDIDAAYYLIHSMSASKSFTDLEATAAHNFVEGTRDKSIRHVIYLTGIVNSNDLSEHLTSRKQVEDILSEGSYNFTALRAGIIIGSGSASFEIIRDIVEKLPIMITPKWILTKCQPIGIRDVCKYLLGTLDNPYTFGKNFDIYGPDILTYKDMLLTYADVRGLKTYIYSIPMMTPKLSSYFLFFITSTTYNLVIALVKSMRVDVVAQPNDLAERLGIEPMTYREALEAAFIKIRQNEVLSSWKDSYVSGRREIDIDQFLRVPKHGCFTDHRVMEVVSRERTLDRIWAIGGTTGWYSGNYLWKLRGYIDKLMGGVGLRRGRRDQATINVGDAIDFWRVLYADKKEGRLLLYAEMRLPGDAWLEFSIKDGVLHQNATFRPRGIWGRVYWYAVLPFHGYIFRGLIYNLVHVV